MYVYMRIVSRARECTCWIIFDIFTRISAIYTSSNVQVINA